MILSCKNCGAKFKVSGDAIGSSGRNVRCSVCAHEWFQEGIQILEEGKAPAQAEPTVKEKSSIRPQTRIVAPKHDRLLMYRRTWLLFLLKTTSFLALMLLLFVLVINYRMKIIESFPEVAQAFEAIRLHDVSNLKLALVDCKLSAAEGDTQSSETIGMNVKVVAQNTGSNAQYLEVVRFSIYTKDKEFIGEYTMHIDKNIEAGKEEVIEGRLDGIPKTINFVVVEMGNLFDIALMNQSEILSHEGIEDNNKGKKIIEIETMI